MTAFAEPTLHQGLLPTLCTNGLWCNSSNWLLFWKGLPHSVLCLERQKYQVFKIAIEFFDYKWAANISAWFSNLSHSELFQVLQKLSCSIRSVYIPLPSSREYGRSFVRSKLRSKWFWEYDRVWASWLLQKASTRLTEEKIAFERTTGRSVNMLNCKINSTNRGTFSNSVRKIILMVSMVQGV